MIDAQNPFFEKYNTPHGTVPFDKIKTEHYEPAIREGIRQHIAEINAITDNPEVPTFDNTLLAYEKSGDLLNRHRIQQLAQRRDQWWSANIGSENDAAFKRTR